MKIKKIFLSCAIVIFATTGLTQAQQAPGKIPETNPNQQNYKQEQTELEKEQQNGNVARKNDEWAQACNQLTNMYNQMMAVNIISTKDSGINGTILRHTSLQRYLTLMLSIQCNLKPIIDIEYTRLRDVEQSANQMQNNLNSQK